ncbi:unnamed protein product [Amaranthus hypochondriacus]
MKSPAPLPPRHHHQQQESNHFLEINLISVQNLKPPSGNIRRLQTYAIVYLDPSSIKLRTRIDKLNAENPNWNDKFIFKVSDEFLSSENSSFMVEIFSVGVLKDNLLGCVRCLLGNFPFPLQTGVHYCVALQIRRPSGRFHGVLNVGVMAIDGLSEVGSTLSGISAIGYREFLGDSVGKNRHRKNHHRRGLSDLSSESESCGGDSVDNSDGTESTASNSSESSGVLKELNGREMAGKGGVILCGLGFQKKVHISTSDALDLENGR